MPRELPVTRLLNAAIATAATAASGWLLGPEPADKGLFLPDRVFWSLSVGDPDNVVEPGVLSLDLHLSLVLVWIFSRPVFCFWPWLTAGEGVKSERGGAWLWLRGEDEEFRLRLRPRL